MRRADQVKLPEAVHVFSKLSHFSLTIGPFFSIYVIAAKSIDEWDDIFVATFSSLLACVSAKTGKLLQKPFELSIPTIYDYLIKYDV
jgi:hypothetical protein